MIKRLFSITVLTGFVAIPILFTFSEEIKIAQAIQREHVITMEREVRKELVSSEYIVTLTPTPSPTPIPTSAPVEILSVDEVEYDPQETVYDWYTEEEVEMIQRLVEAEATAGSLRAKTNVANVVFNRIWSDKFPNTVKEVVFQHKGNRYQFSCIPDNRYYEVKITDSTVKAVEQAFMNDDTTYGALYFCNKRDVKNLKLLKWFRSLEYIMTDDLGQSYYK